MQQLIAQEGSRRQVVLSIAVFLVTLFAVPGITGWFVSRDSSSLYVPELSEKLDVFLEHRDEYDAVFIGTSRIDRHVDPKIFDQELEEQGYKFRSFNLSLKSLNIGEQVYILKVLEKYRPKNLKWVFIEPVDSTINFDNLLGKRSSAMHDLNSTKFSIMMSISQPYGWATRFRHSFTHAVGYLYQTIKAGSISSYLFSGPEHKDKTIISLPYPWQGHLALDDPLQYEIYKERNERFRSNPNVFYSRLNKYKESIEKKSKGVNADVRLSREYQDALENIFNKIRNMGAEPVAIFSVGTKRHVMYKAFANTKNEKFKDIMIVGDRDPLSLNIVYHERYWFDVGHLNQQGAKIYTRSLAKEFAQILDKKAQM